jgi:hypothetical protein
MKDRAGERPLPEHKEVMERFARKIVDWRMTAPAILFLESAKPLSFLGNQALIFFQPIVQSIFSFKTYDEVIEILEDRDNLEYLLSRLEELEAGRTREEREERAKRREERRAARSGRRAAADDAAGDAQASAGGTGGADSDAASGEAVEAPKEGENE